MIAKVCDRCKVTYGVQESEKHNDMEIRTFNQLDAGGSIDYEYSAKRIDLCPKCKEDFKNWMGWMGEKK